MPIESRYDCPLQLPTFTHPKTINCMSNYNNISGVKKGCLKGYICEFVQQLPIEDAWYIFLLKGLQHLEMDVLILPTVISILGLSNGRSIEQRVNIRSDRFFYYKNRQV